ncbi:MAG: sigma-70 family RNA polymerase sigma factor [Actinomycetota bacterium]|nr:sigma-70 family RNA polymerase sigma factor [Actinomycetota bacterium]
MAPPDSGTRNSEAELLRRARDGDEDAFASLTEPHRAELLAHCYRMLGSVYDAEDALQDAMLRTWRGLARFGGRGSLRSWLYTICTNACLDQLGRNARRVLPVDFGPAADPQLGPGEPIVESTWLEPYPDQSYGLADGRAAPEAHYERRESVELAFVAALQHLGANQRAVLLLREVLGFSAKETAAMLDTSVASVNSALQRARAAVQERVPAPSQQATLRSLGDRALRQLVDRYVEAWERCDVKAFTSMLTEDASFAMPPLARWYRGREAIAAWATLFSLSGQWRWRALSTQANGQPALGYYAWDDGAQAYLAFALNVLTLRGELISDVTAFVVRSIEPTDDEAYQNWPRQTADDHRLTGVFERFGLPDRLS